MGGKRFWKTYGEQFHMGTNDQIMQGGRKSFTNAFSVNLDTVNLKCSPAMEGDTLEEKSLPV